MRCMVSRSPGNNPPDEVSEEVLFHGGSIEGSANLQDPATVGPTMGARSVPATT
ncbi:UNVERIFIED_CONTAM: hypothetical protein Slati_3675200 [Sesamum latifolium]|uniref:Uncharacterized protein n=1 Tax=Sesamum latifolium TaxID=2727402 RepID=A0AAW2U0V5_9LAMI